MSIDIEYEFLASQIYDKNNKGVEGYFKTLFCDMLPILNSIFKLYSQQQDRDDLDDFS